MRTRNQWISAGVCLAALMTVAAAAHADYHLVRRVNLGPFFGPLGNNPFTVTFDGTYAYVGGYSAAADPRDIGILKINIDDPADNMALEPGGTQTVSQFRYYGGLVVQDGVLYALTDRPSGTTQLTNVRAVDTSTGALIATFDGDFGTGNGIVTEPAALTLPALGGLAYDPGFGGFDNGLSLIGFGSGRRVLIDILDGLTLYDTSDGMIVADSANPSCTVSDLTSWRDHVYDANGNVYLRRSNQVQRALRSGSNTISGYAHLTDELNADGTPKPGCGDGQPVPTRVGAFTIGQHLALIGAASAGTDEDLVIFNDRYDNSAKSFAAAVKLIGTNGALPVTPVAFLRADGTPLSAADAPNGIGLYDFHWDASRDLLLVLDFANRLLLVFSGEAPTCASPVQDANDDGNIDLIDHALAVGCLAGPAADWSVSAFNHAACVCLDADDDGDFDLADWAELQVEFTGP